VEWVFLGLGAVVVFVIAAAFVGSTAFRLGHQTPAAIFDVEEAVDHVADRLGPEAQARLTYDEVRALILATLDHLSAKGISARPGEEPAAMAPEGPPVVVADDDALAVVLGAVEAQDLEVADEDALAVIDLLLDYLAGIGALGPSVPPPDDPG
jgi:hypothetical protein